MLKTVIILALVAGCSSSVAVSTQQYSGSTATQRQYSTATRATRATTITTNAPTTAHPATNVSDCGCTHNNIWLDVIFIVDNSKSMTQQGLGQLSNYLLTVLEKLTISQNQGQYTRVGLITYAANAQLVYPLNKFKNYDDLFDNFMPSYSGADGSNIEAAIRLANIEFAGQNHRQNVKRVIVIAASHYEPGAWDDPTTAATQFKGDGGVITTLEYVQTHGTTVPILSSLASPCQQLTNRNANLTADAMRDAFCRANCFCATNWQSFGTDSTCGLPNKGCYYPIQIPALKRLADRQCKSMNSAYLTKVESADKALFLENLVNRQAQWLGMNTYNGNAQWEDGTAVGSYQPWGSSPSNGQCAYQKLPSGFNIKWYTDDCDNDYVYTCENRPCSSDLYCN